MFIHPETAREIIKQNDRQQLLAGLGALDGKKKRRKKTAEEKAAEKQEKERRKELHKLTSKKERKKIAKQTKKDRKNLKSATGFVGDLNDGKQPTLPLTEAEEQFRQFSVAGDFNSMNLMAPFGPKHWRKITPLGKYRFVYDQSGNIQYIPWTEADLLRFLNGPWLIRDSKTGLAPLLHPKREIAVDKVGKLKRWSKKVSESARKYNASDIRHVSGITPGEYVYQAGDNSWWVENRNTVATAVAVVAAVYLGPQIAAKLQAGSGAGSAGGAATAGSTGATGGAAAAAGSGAASGAASGAVASGASLGGKVWAGAQALTDYVNKARTIEAMANGEMPPPPIDLTGDSFTEWAMIEAKKELEKQGIKYLTEQQEKEMLAEIRRMQNEAARNLPPNIPMSPGTNLNRDVQNIMLQEKEKNKNLSNILLFAVPAALAYMVL